MRILRELLICFFLAVVEISFCFGQKSGLEDHEIRTGEMVERSVLAESAHPRGVLDAESASVTDEVWNPCFSEEQNKNVTEYHGRSDQLKSTSGGAYWASAEHRSKSHILEELPLQNDTSHPFSDHFLNCIHIGFEPGTFEFLPNGSLHIIRHASTFDKSEFCQDGTGAAYVCDDLVIYNGKNTTGSETNASLYSHLSDEFLNCSGGHVRIEKGLFERFSNRSVYVAEYDRLFNYSNHVIGGDGELFICPHFFHKETKFSEAYDIVTILGLSVSILFIVLYMIFFIFMESLRNLPGYCLFSLCLALLMAYACFLIRSMKPSADQCRDLVLSTIFFFLAAFFWMNVLSFDVWRSLRMATSKLRLSKSMLWKRFALYSLYAWLTPLSIVLFSVLFTKYNNSVQFMRLEINPVLCWVAKKGPLFAYLALPLIILMCLNVIFFTTSFIMIGNASMNTAENMATFWKRFWLFLKLAVIMGVSWIFGIIAGATNEPVLFYIFAILNSLQGVFIFFSFALSDKAKNALKTKLGMRKSSVFPSQVTSQPAQSVTTI